MHTPLLFAHRGDTVHFPENTIDAFQSAFDLGAEGIELDVHVDETGEVIVVHDYLYDRSKRYPTLADVLEKFGQKGRLEIEIKSFDHSCIEKVAKLLKKYQPKDIELTSSILPLLPLIRTALPDAKIGMIFRSNLLEDWMTPEIISLFILGYLELTKANVIHLALEHYTSALVKQLHERKYLLHTHLKTGDTQIFNHVRELGIDQCTFDDINLLIERNRV